MDERWQDTNDDSSASAHSRDFWAEKRTEADKGGFWADRIKEYRDDPERRLSLALENLPLPAAFGEAAIALRAQIRSKRAAGKPYEDELKLLYWLAAIRSFMLDYAPRLMGPGFDVVAAIPGQRLRTLDIDYSQLGYRDLSLLNKTDARWLVETWGQPKAHTTLNALHRSLWDEYESKMIQARRQADESWQVEIASLVGEAETPRRSHRKTRTTGCSTLLLAAAIVTAVVILLCWS